jgi:hypothetical protein
MQLVRPMWQPSHPSIPWCEANDWLAYVRDSAKYTPFNRLRETMRLAWRVLGDGPNIPRLVRIGPMACTIDGQAVSIDTLRNLVGELLCEANQMMSNQISGVMRLKHYPWVVNLFLYGRVWQLYGNQAIVVVCKIVIVR